MSIKAIIFDMGNVLIQHDEAPEHAAVQVMCTDPVYAKAQIPQLIPFDRVHRGEFTLEDLFRLSLELALLRPAKIHTQEHLSPILRLGAAGAGVDADDGIRGVMLSAEKLLQLRRFDFLLPLVEVRNEIVADALALLGPLDERRDLFVADVQLVDEIEVGLKTATLARELLAFGRICPDVRVCELAF